MKKSYEKSLEKARKKLLRSFLKQYDKKVFKRCKPTTFGCHEAFHTINVLMNTFQNEVYEHPTIVSNKKWFKRADKIIGEMYDLYKSIGQVHI